MQTQRFTSWSVPKGWEQVWNTPEAIHHLTQAYTKLQQLQGVEIYPPEYEIFRAFDLCPLDQLTVVIIGQDPYHKLDKKVGRPMANGLSFSGNRGGETPRSLSNVFKEIKRTFPSMELNHYDLTSWAMQGVLLLNTCLTVTNGTAKSHIKLKIWDDFFNYILKAICYLRPQTVYCLWGDDAKTYSKPSKNGKAIIQSQYILESGHPSPLNRSPDNQFIGNNHFYSIYCHIESLNVQIREYNNKNNQTYPEVRQINWTLV